MDALAGDAELAGDLGLADAGGKQLSGTQPTRLEPFAFLLCCGAAGTTGAAFGRSVSSRSRSA